ncbi:putative AC transposase, partial [Bienertia sinuspersici]
MHDLDSSCVSIGDAQSNVDAYLNSPLMALPITLVAAESSFSMGGRVLTKYRSSLRTNNIEAFVTTQNWLFGYLKDDE